MPFFRPTAPWFSAGLAFECAGCGRCCAGPEDGFVWANEQEIAALAAHLNMEIDVFRRRYMKRVGRRFTLIMEPTTKDCPFLSPPGEEGRHCTVYEVRPTQCRTWPFWPSNLMHPDDWARTGMRCPGINRGKLHTCTEIESRLHVTRE